MRLDPLEEVAASGSGATLWFQLYIFRDRGLTRSLVERALTAGYQALCVTIDVPVAGARERDVRNGFTVPPRAMWSMRCSTSAFCERC